MHGEARHWQARLRRELGDPRLVVRWNVDAERYEVGQIVAYGASDVIEWFYAVTDGNNGFRPLDGRVIRKLRTLDKAHQPNWTPSRFRQHLVDEKADLDEKRREEFRYQLAHETKFAAGRFWNVGAPKREARQ
jgi:hypothetical protein